MIGETDFGSRASMHRKTIAGGVLDETFHIESG